MRTFLTSLGLDRYCKAFEEAEVDMCAVDVMEESDYVQLGVAKVRLVYPWEGGGRRGVSGLCVGVPALRGSC